MGSAIGALLHKAGNQVTLIDVARPAIDAIQSRGLIIQNKAGEKETVRVSITDYGIGMTPEDARSRFGFLLDALKSGAPPHGGIALGLDRLCMILGGTTNIRDVIAFPKNQKARDLMTGAPAGVEPRQLRDLGLKQN